MTFIWKDYLDVAKNLRGDSIACSSEARLRSGVSRAYYAAFCHARDYARKNLGYQATGRAQDHQTLKGYYGKHGLSAIALKLDDLRTWRNICDYDDQLAASMNIQRLINAAIKRAEDIISQL